jgi:(-)-germacrene D synthase
MDELPEYMKFCYEALLDVYTETEQELASEGRSYRIDYAREAVIKPQFFVYIIVNPKSY